MQNIPIHHFLSIKVRSKAEKKTIRDAVVVLALLKELAGRKKVVETSNSFISSSTGITLPNIWKAKKYLSKYGYMYDKKVREGGRFNGQVTFTLP